MGNRKLDLIDAMVLSADNSLPDEEVAKVEACSCPGCGCCSGMFTANSMNCLTEAIGLSLPGNGTVLATHVNRTELFKKAAALVVENAWKYYRDGDEPSPRRPAWISRWPISTNSPVGCLAFARWRPIRQHIMCRT